MKLEMVGLTDTGVVRENNEDNYGLFHEQNIGLVCDGMGGHNAGAIASQIAVETIKGIINTKNKEILLQLAPDIDPDFQALIAPVVLGFRLANLRIFNMATQKSEFRGMGTTVAFLGFQEGQAILAHAGDSRIYRIRDREIVLLTEDHSWLNELLQDKEIDKDEARNFEKKNVITRALGMAPRVKVDLKIEPVEAGDLYILCTDGLTNSINDDLIQAITVNYQDDLKSAADHLVNMAKQVDGSDNITVALIKVLEVGIHHNSLKKIEIKIAEEDDRVSALENKYLRRNDSFIRKMKYHVKSFFLSE